MALVIGAVSLRTSGIDFIMITLAFAQMLYFLGISLEEYGGDDGMRLAARSEFAGSIDLATTDVVLLPRAGAPRSASCYLVHRAGRTRASAWCCARRGRTSGAWRAIGFPPLRYKLAAFVISGAMCGVAGVLLANLTAYLTPDFMHWTRSGDLMVMVILGGMGTLRRAGARRRSRCCCSRTCCRSVDASTG